MTFLRFVRSFGAQTLNDFVQSQARAERLNSKLLPIQKPRTNRLVSARVDDWVG